jgi:hypothetical protein
MKTRALPKAVESVAQTLRREIIDTMSDLDIIGTGWSRWWPVSACFDVLVLPQPAPDLVVW